jgi:mannose-6-phosphate isomerase
MSPVFKLRNTIQPYAWGSRRMLAEFMNRPVPSSGPEAELWMGAHPKAPSRIQTPDGWSNLDTAIRNSPKNFLGPEMLSRFGPRLPFLFKILAVDQPLSLQAHPDKRRAEEGFRRENAQGIALRASNRNYRDDNHKPELICALTSFQGLCGFRKPMDAYRLLQSLWPPGQLAELELLTRGWRPFYEFLVTRPADWQQRLCSHAATCAASLSGQTIEFQWVERLQRIYPGDIGILAPLLLNLVRLEAGQALFLPAGRLHAYLHGLGIEIMANSDNVLRGGLTSKHIDAPELMRILDFEPGPAQIFTPQAAGPNECVYPVSADEFRLSIISTNDDNSETALASWGPEILLCSRNKAHIVTDRNNEIGLVRGESVFMPARTGNYVVKGSAELFRAAVGFPGAL